MSFKFPFNNGDTDGADMEERRKFWDSAETIRWFKEHGYTLYRRVMDDEIEFPDKSVPSLPFKDFQEAEYPYAYYDASGTKNPLCVYDFMGKVVYAQDDQARHVAIKVVPKDTNEYRILRFLQDQTPETLKDNCVMPVVDILYLEGYYFVVMPRWGTSIHYPALERAYEVLDIIHALLKALAFLHKNNISHGDIKLGNVAVNHFADSTQFHGDSSRAKLRAQRLLSYALFDFDFSIMLPPEMDRKAYRLPYQRSWGTYNLTKDTAQGEFDFNPFVHDVGCLGVILCSRWQHLCGQLPFLAPFLDRMTTRNLKFRFTAPEALHFFEDMYSQLTESELRQSIVDEVSDPQPYYEYNRWAAVPPEFAKKWIAYRESPVPLATRLLRNLCQYTWIFHLVAHLRWLTYRTSSIIHSVLSGRSSRNT